MSTTSFVEASTNRFVKWCMAQGEYNSLARRVVHARELGGFDSQAALARAIGCKPQAIQSIESGRTKKSRLLLDIARACRVDPGWLVSNEGTPRPGPLAREPKPHPALDAAAVEVARLWMRLPKHRRAELKREIFLATTIAEHFPWLQAGRPETETYAEFERRVEGDFAKLAKAKGTV